MSKEERRAMHLVGNNEGESLLERMVTYSVSTLLEVLTVAHAVSVLDLAEGTWPSLMAHLRRIEEVEEAEVHARRRSEVQTAVGGLVL